MTVRIGDVMIKRGLLSEAQVRRVLEEQSRRHRPFGELAESLFGIDPTDVEQAWVEQYASLTRHVDLGAEAFEARALALVDRRQAWQFRVMPIRFDGSELMVATTSENLTRALRFVSRCLPVPCYLVLAEARRLGEALEQRYPLAGLGPDAVRGHIPAMALLQDD